MKRSTRFVYQVNFDPAFDRVKWSESLQRMDQCSQCYDRWANIKTSKSVSVVLYRSSQMTVLVRQRLRAELLWPRTHFKKNEKISEEESN